MKNETRNITAETVNNEAKAVKSYQKSFNGVRSAILQGKADKEVEITPFVIKVLKASKKDSSLYKWLVAECEYKGTFERADGSKGEYSNVYAPHRTIQKIAKLANNDELQVKFALKF